MNWTRAKNCQFWRGENPYFIIYLNLNWNSKVLGPFRKGLTCSGTCCDFEHIDVVGTKSVFRVMSVFVIWTDMIVQLYYRRRFVPTLTMIDVFGIFLGFELFIAEIDIFKLHRCCFCFPKYKVAFFFLHGFFWYLLDTNLNYDHKGISFMCVDYEL